MNIVTNKLDITSKVKPSKKLLPPVIKELLPPTTKEFSTSKRRKTITSIASNKPKRNSIISQYHQQLNPDTGAICNVYNLDIDHFIIKKNREIVESPWDLNAINATFTGVSKSTFTRQESTENLVTKLKNIFREKYNPTSLSHEESNFNSKSNIHTQSFNFDSSLVSSLSGIKSTSNKTKNARNNFETRNDYAYVNNKNESLYVAQKPSNNYFSTVPQPLILTDKTGSIYLKKLKNNYYDRKLWYNLLLNTKDCKFLNIYADKAHRDYNTEFDILDHHSKISNFENRKHAFILN